MALGKNTIFVVDDKEEGRFVLKRLLNQQGFSVVEFENGEGVLEAALKEAPTAIMLDMHMPKVGGMETLSQLKADSEAKYIPVILVTASQTTEDIVQAFEIGVDDYIMKPYRSEELLARMRSAIHLKKLYSELKQERDIIRTSKVSSDFIGTSAAISHIRTLVAKVAPSDAPVLIVGESGSGKEVVAREIVVKSNRSDKPFLSRNCAAFHENLLESELFGHVKGAFTGAITNQRGVFELADGGTLFLDEVGEMSPTLQAKLLRVLQDGVIQQIGNSSEKKIDVRIIAATHRNLELMVQQGTFREDLYYRMNVFKIDVPPLRKRSEDIPDLIQYFLTKGIRGRKYPQNEIRTDVLDLFKNAPWKGNIRELQNEIERMSIIAGDEKVLTMEHLLDSQRFSSPTASTESMSDSTTQKSDFTDSDEDFDVKLQTEKLEKTLIQRALHKSQGNRSQAAKLLNLSRSSLIAKIELYEITE
jgi:DNA-binding NtrC family response regulator